MSLRGGPAQAQDPQAHAWVLAAPGRRSFPEKHLLCSHVFADPSVGRIWPFQFIWRLFTHLSYSSYHLFASLFLLLNINTNYEYISCTDTLE